MRRTIIETADGSKTIHLPDWDEHYHSKHGAVQEAQHVFIKSGLHHHCKYYRNEVSQHKISILEIGFGTGLNAYLTLLEATKLDLQINYVGVEAFPVNEKELKLLNYSEIVQGTTKDELFDTLHSVAWESEHQITERFALTKRKQLFTDIKDSNKFDLIYFDAFGPRVQPELWTENIFRILYKALKLNGVLVTYSAKGSVRRAMLSVGFAIERLQGPPGKREMLRATVKS